MGVLDTIKNMLGINSEVSNFDQELLVHINSCIMSLTQIGIGPNKGFIVSDKTEWNELLQDSSQMEASKMFIYIKTKTIFDPPTTSYVLDAMNRSADELLWRLSVITSGDSEVII